MRFPSSRRLLAAAVVLQWLTTIAIALHAAHDGWRWGDPARSQELVGSDAAVAAIVLLNVLVLGPLALACAHRIALRAGGVALGAWTLLVWVTTPWALEVLSLARYDPTLRDRVLPLWAGLTPEPGYPAGVALLVAVALLSAVRLRLASLGAGVAVGAAVLLVPVTVVVLVPFAVALLAGRRPRALGVFLLAAAPAVVVALLWRDPSFGDLSRDSLDGNLAGLREYFWSQRMLEWAPVAGVIGLARRSVPLAILVGGWFGVLFAVEATRVGVGYENGEIFRVLLPALPAYVLLVAAIPLLVPTLATRLGPLARPAP